MDIELLEIYRVLRRRRWLIAVLVAAAGFCSYTTSKLSPKIYEARSKILVLDKKSGTLSILTEIGGMPKNQVQNYVEVLRSQSLLKSVAERLRMDPERLPRNFTVQPVQGTDIIEIRARSADRRLAQRFVNTLVNSFLDRCRRENQEDARLAREFIQEQLEIVGRRLIRAEASLSAYQKSARLISPTDEARLVIEKLAQMEAERASLEVDITGGRARLNKVEQELPAEEKTLISSRVLARNPVYERYRERLSALNVELTALLAQYTEKHPTVVAKKAEIAKVQEDLGREMETIVASQTESLNPIHQTQLQQALTLQAEIMANEAARKALADEIARLDGKLAVLPDKEMHLARLARDKASAETIYTMLTTKKSETEITEHMRTADVSLVDPAYLPLLDRPVKPNTRLNVAVAVFLGLFLGAGLAFLLEYLDPSIKTREEVETLLALPVFGMIPDDEIFAENGHRRRRHHAKKHRATSPKDERGMGA